MNIKIEYSSLYFPFLVSNDLGLDLILGIDFISKTGIIIDVHEKLSILSLTLTDSVTFVTETPSKFLLSEYITCIDQDDQLLNHLSEPHKVNLKTLISEFPWY